MTKTQLHQQTQQLEPDLATPKTPELEQPNGEKTVLDQAGGTPTEAPLPSPRRSNRRWIFAIAGLVVVAIGSVFGWRWWQFQQTHVITDNAQIEGHLSPLSAKIPATVQQVLVQEGDPVKAGQPILILEDQDLQLKVQEAQAALASAKAKLASATDTVQVTQQTTPAQVQQSQAKFAASQSAVQAAQAEVAQAEAQIETRQAAVAQAQTAVNKTQADYQRYAALYNAGAVSAQQFDTYRAAYRDAQAQLTAAQKNVNQAQAALTTAQAQVQARIAEAKLRFLVKLWLCKKTNNSKRRLKSNAQQRRWLWRNSN